MQPGAALAHDIISIELLATQQRKHLSAAYAPPHVHQYASACCAENLASSWVQQYNP